MNQGVKVSVTDDQTRITVRRKLQDNAFIYGEFMMETIYICGNVYHAMDRNKSLNTIRFLEMKVQCKKKKKNMPCDVCVPFTVSAVRKKMFKHTAIRNGSRSELFSA
jgi:hypothetical protein